MFHLVGLVLWVASIYKFKVYYPILSRNSKHRWLFRLFFLIYILYISTDIIRPSLLPSLYKSFILLTAILPLIPYYLLNKNKLYILIFIIGITSNHFTIILNNGYMPASKEAVIRWRGELLPIKNDGEIIIRQSFKYKYIDDNTVAPFLGDIIYFPYAGGVFSIGDWLMYLSFITFLLTKFEKK